MAVSEPSVTATTPARRVRTSRYRVLGEGSTLAINFITIAVNFIILAFVIFLMVKQINRLRAEPKPAEAPPPPEDIVLLREIRDSLKRP